MFVSWILFVIWRAGEWTFTTKYHGSTSWLLVQIINQNILALWNEFCDKKHTIIKRQGWYDDIEDEYKQYDLT